jgi:UDP-N-acetylmuramoylalanine--D-glutamate ligase
MDDTMKAGVIGLGVEGKKATKSLLNHGWEVYATDLNTEIDLTDIGLDMEDFKSLIKDNKISSNYNNKLSIDLGFNNLEILDRCNTIVLSPSLWKSEIAKKFKSKKVLICDVLNKHKNIFTIGITGTNGKTTSSLMLKEILENSGKKVLIGGNGGGGFSGYCDLILEAEYGDYDIIIVEVCDMTLEFCDYNFNFDLMALTNIGNDHMDVHGSIDNYKNKLKKVFENKNIVVNEDDGFFEDYNKIAKKLIPYNESKLPLKLAGKFNRLNAGLSISIAEYLNINKEVIKNSLENFTPVDGRLKVFKLNNSTIYIGKTDNSDATKAVLDEKKFNTIFIGTAGRNENHRLAILDEVVNHDPGAIVLFPGLSSSFKPYFNRLNHFNYNGKILTAEDNNKIIDLIIDFSNKKNNIFVGGNGQEKIIELQRLLQHLSSS